MFDPIPEWMKNYITKPNKIHENSMSKGSNVPCFAVGSQNIWSNQIHPK